MQLDSSGAVVWQNRYGGEQRDWFSGAALAADGGLIVAGASQSFDLAEGDAWALKVDENGEAPGCQAVTPMFGSAEDTAEAGVDSSATVLDSAAVVHDTSATALDTAAYEGGGCSPIQIDLVGLPKTGLADSSYPLDDGALQAGRVWPAPRFQDNEDGTVTDNLTGLMWLQDANCAATIGHDPDGAGGGGMLWQSALDFVGGNKPGHARNHRVRLL